MAPRGAIATVIQDAPDIGRHCVAFAAALTSMWLIHHLQVYLFGADFRFFGFVPLAWVIDAADLSMLAVFVMKLANHIWKG
jgi:hypothetical protein